MVAATGSESTSTETGSTIQVMVVEDHPLSRQGLVFGLKRAADLAVVAEADNGETAIEVAQEKRPQVILMDIVLPRKNGIEAAMAIKQQLPQCHIIMLTSHSDREKVFASLKSGASAYCMKELPLEQIIEVIRLVHSGGVYLDPQIAGYLMSAVPVIEKHYAELDPDSAAAMGHSDELTELLTEREREVLKLLAKGWSNKDIADELCISVYTVKNHVSSLIQKLAVDDRTQAAITAIQRGLI